MPEEAIQRKPEWEIVSHRWHQWQSFESAPRCILCRAKNDYRESAKSDIRVTPLGDVCLSCWIDRETCEVCGLGPVAEGFSGGNASLVFKGRKVCADCLLPEVAESVWRDWLLFYIYMPASSFSQVLSEAFAEDFEREPARHTRRAMRHIMEIPWPLIDSVQGWYDL